MVRLGAGVGRPWAEGIARARSPPFQYGCVARGGGLGGPAQDGARACGPPAHPAPWPRGRSTQREQGRHLLAGGTSRHHSARCSLEHRFRTPTV